MQERAGDLDHPGTGIGRGFGGVRNTGRRQNGCDRHECCRQHRAGSFRLPPRPSRQSEAGRERASPTPSKVAGAIPWAVVSATHRTRGFRNDRRCSSGRFDQKTARTRLCTRNSARPGSVGIFPRQGSDQRPPRMEERMGGKQAASRDRARARRRSGRDSRHRRRPPTRAARGRSKKHRRRCRSKVLATGLHNPRHLRSAAATRSSSPRPDRAAGSTAPRRCSSDPRAARTASA